MTRILAIEMSQREGSVAFGTIASPQMLRFAADGARDSDPLMPAIDSLIRGAGAAPRDIDAIAVSVGPGGFTGLRIATTTAKVLADSLDRPLIAVPSALVAAASSALELGQDVVLVALAAKGASCWLSAARREGDSARSAGFDGLVDAASLGDVCTRVAAKALLADAHAPSELLARARELALPVSAPAWRADALLRVGGSMLVRGETADPATLTPLYPREPEAVTLWRQRHAR